MSKPLILEPQKKHHLSSNLINSKYINSQNILKEPSIKKEICPLCQHKSPIIWNNKPTFTCAKCIQKMLFIFVLLYS